MAKRRREMEKREKAVLKRERRDKRKQAGDAGPSTFSDPAQEAGSDEPETEQTITTDGEAS
jgi:hypothetical protein